MGEIETGGAGGEFEPGDFEIGPFYSGTINLLYSPETDDLIESLEYPNQMWLDDDMGSYRLFIIKVQPVVSYVKYYLVGTL